MPSKQPLVSICIPTYNRPALLKKALQSCFNQTYKNYEIIILDSSKNNLTKKTICEINDLRITYKKTVVNFQKKNNIFFNFIKGKYVQFLSDDDLLEPAHIKKMVEIFEKYPKVGIVMAPLDIIDKQDKRIYPRFYIIKKMNLLYRYLNHNSLIKKEAILKDFLTRKYPCCVPSGIMFRKEGFDQLGHYDERADFAIDVEICMRFATKYDFYYVDEVLSSWRFSKKTATFNIHQNGVRSKIFYYLVKKYCQNKKWQRDSYFFASKRAFLLNTVASIRSLDPGLFLKTLALINKEDPYLLNKIKLPLSIFTEILKTF